MLCINMSPAVGIRTIQFLNPPAMPLSASSELPIIDFSKDAMKPATTTWDLTRKQVLKALEEYGCFKATFNEINNELYNAMFSSLEKLFDLPKDTKRRFTSDEPFQGYVSDMPRRPLNETMGVSDPLDIQTIQNLTLTMWPQGDANFCETLYTYVTRVSNLEKTVRRMIYESYGMERYFEEESKSMKCSIRIMKYGAPMTDEDTLGVITHYDLNFVTILQEDGVGLQVQDNDGKWIYPMPSGSSFIVQLGESFHGWSNGRLKCCLHRVRTSGYKSRHSIGFFTSKEGTVKIHSELVDEQHPMLFKPFDQPGLLQVFMQQIEDKAYASHDENIVPNVATHFAI